jgi:FkbM family methyltransferase
MLKTLNEQDLCIDCGANVGKYTLMLAQTGAQVHAFEPDPDAFNQLSRTLMKMSNVTLWNAAVGTTDSEVPLFRAIQHSPGSTKHTVSSSILNESYRLEKESRTLVKQIDFGRFLDNLPKSPSLIKMDIEGAEVDILEMLFNTKRIEKIGTMFVETHEKQIPSLRSRTLALIAKVQTSPYSNINFDWH